MPQQNICNYKTALKGPARISKQLTNFLHPHLWKEDLTVLEDNKFH